MSCGVMGEDLIVRVGAERAEELLAEPGARAFDFTGRPMKGWLYVEPAAIAEEEDLERWVRRGESFAASLPPKR